MTVFSLFSGPEYAPKCDFSSEIGTSVRGKFI